MRSSWQFACRGGRPVRSKKNFGLRCCKPRTPGLNRNQDQAKLPWRAHSGVPYRYSYRHPLARVKTSVEMSLDAARTVRAPQLDWKRYHHNAQLPFCPAAIIANLHPELCRAQPRSATPEAGFETTSVPPGTDRDRHQAHSAGCRRRRDSGGKQDAAGPAAR